MLSLPSSWVFRDFKNAETEGFFFL
jgi:hypothetical protein